MRNSRRRRRGAQENHDRWLITYADLITLLMIFFVILYAMSQVDVQKYETLARQLSLQFRDADSLLEKGSSLLDGNVNPEKFETPPPPAPKTETEDAAAKKERKLQDLLKIIQQYVKDNRLNNEVFVEDTPKGIAIRLSDRFLFDLGRANLKAPALPVLDRLSSLFAKLETTVSVQGHTDNLALQAGASFRDNWELSAARALSVLRYFVDEKKLEEHKFEVAGYADTRPIASNDSEDGRQKNRRVEILVLRQE